MSSNPLMMGYEGGDLLLTGVAGQWSGRCPGLCVLDRRTTSLTAGLTAYATMRYINRRSLPFIYYVSAKNRQNWMTSD